MAKITKKRLLAWWEERGKIENPAKDSDLISFLEMINGKNHENGTAYTRQDIQEDGYHKIKITLFSPHWRIHPIVYFIDGEAVRIRNI